jgi:hypothetical protein
LNFRGLAACRRPAYHGLMDHPHPDDELAGLRKFLKALETGDLTISRKGVDISQDEIVVIKRDIAFLEKIIARNKAGAQSA